MHFDSKGTVANPVFVEKNQPDLKFQNMFTALFGTRFRYLLEINPFTGLDLSGVDAEAIDKLLNNLVSLWDESDHVVFDLDKEQRDTMSENNGINGHHIANLIRWYGLILVNNLLDLYLKREEKLGRWTNSPERVVFGIQ